MEVFNSRIKLVQKLCPDEFDRKVPTTDHMKAWKATSYRQFFLYLAFPLLEDLVDEETLQLLQYFQYFFYLIGGADPNPVPEEDLIFGQEIIEFWVSSYLHETKGAGAKPSIHFLLHIVDDCRFHQCHFDVLSAFRYENALREVKGDITSGNYKMEQLRNRMIERSKFSFNHDIDGRVSKDSDGNISMGWCADDTGNAKGIVREITFEDSTKYSKLILPEVEVSNCFKDSFVLIRDPLRLGSLRTVAIVQVVEIKERIEDNSLSIVGHRYKKLNSLFTAPAESKIQHVYEFSDKDKHECAFPASSVVAKLYVVPRFSRFGTRNASDEMVGDKYCNVSEWVGIALRHSVAEKATLY
jgi:hypothetical protein